MLQTRGIKRSYTPQDLYPNPFDRNIYMPPFPENFSVPKFDKYRGKGHPKDHIRELYASCMEIHYDDKYLMHLFPQSLSRQVMDWYARLPSNIKSWNELTEKFNYHFTFNIDNEVTMIDLCTTK